MDTNYTIIAYQIQKYLFPIFPCCMYHLFRAVHSYTVFTYQPVAVQLGVEEEGGESRSTARLCFSAAVSDFRWRTSKIDFYKKTIAAALISGREQWTGHVRVCVHSVQ